MEDATATRDVTTESPTIIKESPAPEISETPYQDSDATSSPTITINISKDYSLSKTSSYTCSNSVPVTLRHKCIGCSCHT